MSLLAYLGPETMLPMTSVLAGILGFIMMFGRKALELVMGLFGQKKAVAPPRNRARGHRPTTSRTVGASMRPAATDPDDADEAQGV